MAGVPGNQWTLALGKQTAKGTPQTTPTFKLKATGGDITPNAPVIQLAETDASAQAGASLKVGPFDVQGSPSVYLRPADAGLLLYSAMGGLSTTGTTNYTHTITPVTQPSIFLTGYKAIGSTVLVDRYLDLITTSFAVAGAAGQPLTCTPTFQGLSYLLNQTDPALAVVTGTPYIWPEVTMSKAGSDPGTIDSFDMTINRNGSQIVGDVGYGIKDYVWGKFEVSGSYTQLFENDDDYNRFYGGSAAATTPAVTVYTEALVFSVTRDANTSIVFTMTGVSYKAYPVSPDPGGAPIRVNVQWATEPQTTLALNLTVVCKNQTASY